MLLSILVLICTVAVFLGYINPLSHWGSYWCVFRATYRDKQLPKRVKLRLLTYLLRDLVLSPLHCSLWLLDEMIFLHKLNQVRLKDPVFIISQPRSGSTFLHRLLADDKDVFFAVTYLEWRWPYICVWWLLDRLRLRDWINSWSYWPTTSSLASKMHPHLYGDHEEHGIFLEEKFYHHYFVFRRFPFISLLHEIVHFDTLSSKDQKRLLDVFERVIRKVAYYRGKDRIWLTKENESVSFYRSLLRVFPDTKLLFLVRDPKDMLPSYVTLSRASTWIKSGIDKSSSQRWYRANLEFRKRECAEFVDFYYNWVSNETRNAVLLNYNDLVDDVFWVMLKVYSNLKIVMSNERYAILHKITWSQRVRFRDYELINLSDKDISGFDKFVDLVRSSQQKKGK